MDMFKYNFDFSKFLHLFTTARTPTCDETILMLEKKCRKNVVCIDKKLYIFFLHISSCVCGINCSDLR